MVVRNPMNFWCAPNQCTPDYIGYRDFEQFVAFGLFYCALDQEDCSFQVTDSFVYSMREGFLTTLRYMIFKYWDGELERGAENIDMPSNGNIIHLSEADDEEGEDDFFAWYPFRVDGEENEDASLSIELTLNSQGQDTVLWLKLKAIEDKAHVRAILKMADAAVGPNQVECHYFTEGNGKGIPDLLAQFEVFKTTKNFERLLDNQKTFSWFYERMAYTSEWKEYWGIKTPA